MAKTFHLLLLVATIIIATTLASAVPPRTLFLRSTFLDKAVQTQKRALLGTISSFHHKGKAGTPLPLTFAQCPLSFATTSIVMPAPAANIVIETAVVDGSKIHVRIPAMSGAINMSVSDFGVDCSSNSNLAALLLNTRGGKFSTSFPLSGPLLWEFDIDVNGTAAPVAKNGRLISQISAAFSAKYQPGTGFALDSYVQSYFASVASAIRGELQAMLSGLLEPLSELLTSSMSLVRAPCAVATNSSIGSVQFVVAGANCSIAPWQITPDSFLLASDLTMSMPYYDTVLARKKDKKRGAEQQQQCSSCCVEPCPKPLQLSADLTMSFTGCSACFLGEESAAANVTFS